MIDTNLYVYFAPLYAFTALVWNMDHIITIIAKIFSYRINSNGLVALIKISYYSLYFSFVVLVIKHWIDVLENVVSSNFRYIKKKN